ncbi:hypothetical protein [Nocardia sp. Marseille-Q1738]
MSEMSVAAAAAELAVTPRQVARLAQAGELDVVREIGGVFLLDSASVHRWAQARRYRGRPWSEGVAWAALAWMSGQPVDWISSAQMTRLKHRLRRSSAQEVAFLARRRARTHRLSGWDESVEGILDCLVASGVSALERKDLAARFGLAESSRGIEGYVLDEDFETVVNGFGLIADGGERDVVVRVTTSNVFADEQAPLAAVAVDLMDSLDTRERSAGARVLQELLDGIR